NTTQCSSGAVQQGKYETSSFFSKIGVISGRDLTTEAALTKMMHLLANTNSREEIIQSLEKDICGEMTA
ncbi:MAG: L-asparaginase 1, partial [Flavobacteriales bacterium]